MTHQDKQLLYPLFWLGLWLLSLLAFSADASTHNATDKDSWQFDVFLDDSKIGYHHFSRETADGVEHIISEAEFNVRFMFFTVYHYRHSSHEKWRNGCLLKLESKTDDNGDEQFVKLNRNSKQSRIETERTQLTSDECIRSFAYWDLSQLDTSILLNSQTGKLMNVSLRKLGKETLQQHQSPVEARHYQLVGEDIEIDLWYTQDNQWLALQSTTESGSLIRYQLKPESSQDTADQPSQQNSEPKQ
jgi:predicted 3-demethylubiquinone-9 3-methyltransferase (glyoxalase superfamily)